MNRLIHCTQLILFVAICWWLAEFIPWAEALQQCALVSIPMLMCVLVQRYLPYVMLGGRLSKLLPHRLNTWSGFQVSVLCVGCNSILPARMGEIVKIIWLQRHTGKQYATVFGIVFLERLLDVTILLFLVGLFAIQYIRVWLVICMLICVVAFWMLTILLATHQGIGERILQWKLLPPKLHPWLESLFTALHEIWAERLLFKAIGVTALVWAMNYIHVGLLANGLMHLQLSWEELGLLCSVLFFSSALLLVPGGIGTMEAAVLMVLQMFGVEAAMAAATALFARIFYTLPPLLGAVAVLIGSDNGLIKNIQAFKADHTRTNCIRGSNICV